MTSGSSLWPLQQAALAMAAPQGMIRRVPEAEGAGWVYKVDRQRWGTAVANAACLSLAPPPPLPPVSPPPPPASATLAPQVAFPYAGQEFEVHSLPSFNEAHTVLLCLMSEPSGPALPVPLPPAAACSRSHPDRCPANYLQTGPWRTSSAASSML